MANASFNVTKIGMLGKHLVRYFWFQTGEKSKISNANGHSIKIIQFSVTFIDKRRNY